MSDIAKLREHLFETLEGLKNNSIDLDHAKAISETAQTIINSAKVEVDFMRVTGQQTTSGFITVQQATPRPSLVNNSITANGVKHSEAVPGGSIVTHRMR